MKAPLPRLVFAAILALLPQAASALTDAEAAALLTTRTDDPQPSPALAKALELDVAPWHKPGAKKDPRIRLDDEQAGRSAAVALAALDKLPAEAMQTDYDRSWVTFERASALRDLGRGSEAAAAFEAVLAMPKTTLMGRRASAALHDLGQTQRMGNCRALVLGRKFFIGAPTYPSFAAQHRIGGWADVHFVVQADGSVTDAVVRASSMRIFEQPVVDWVLGLHLQQKNGQPPGEACYASYRPPYRIHGGWELIPFDAVKPEERYTYRSIGAAIRERVVAHDAFEKFLATIDAQREAGVPCPNPAEVRIIPMKGYYGGDAAFDRLRYDDSCETALLASLESVQPMEDPRQMPPDARFKVADAALFALLDRYREPLDHILPPEVRSRMPEHGASAYFNYVETPAGRGDVVRRARLLAKH